jgi:hypothetical protein
MRCWPPQRPVAGADIPPTVEGVALSGTGASREGDGLCARPVRRIASLRGHPLDLFPLPEARASDLRAQHSVAGTGVRQGSMARAQSSVSEDTASVLALDPSCQQTLSAAVIGSDWICAAVGPPKAWVHWTPAAPVVIRSFADRQPRKSRRSDTVRLYLTFPIRQV